MRATDRRGWCLAHSTVESNDSPLPSPDALRYRASGNAQGCLLEVVTLATFPFRPAARSFFTVPAGPRPEQRMCPRFPAQAVWLLQEGERGWNTSVAAMCVLRLGFGLYGDAGHSAEAVVPLWVAELDLQIQIERNAALQVVVRSTGSPFLPQLAVARRQAEALRPLWAAPLPSKDSRSNTRSWVSKTLFGPGGLSQAGGLPWDLGRR
jgi:hypothetical protein